LHRLNTDEIFHFYLGDPVIMLNLYSDGGSRLFTLGQDILSGHRLQHLVPYDVWQGACLADGGEFALLGTTMAPGFDFDDYVAGDRDELIAKYPDHKDLIIKLTD
jgi:hypothetical protein